MAMTFRFTEPKDAEELAQWAAENPQIDREDIRRATKKENPTTTFLVVEQDGEVVLAMPVYLMMRIGYLLFNPRAGQDAREAAMEHMLKAVQAFAMAYQVNLDVLTKSGIPVAEWARGHGFDPDPRELFTLKNFSRPSEQETVH
jgi:hypothetical protein